MSATLKMAAGSVAVGLIVFALKYFAWMLTGSVALYSDALESIVNVAAACAATAAIWVGQQPPSEARPYGHYKAEYFSAGLEGALIIIAAAAIFHEALGAFSRPHVLEWKNPGMLVNAAAGLLNGLWSWALIRQGRKLNSPALVADGRHLLADVQTSIGVLGGVIVAAVSGWSILDPLIAMAVAVHVLWAGWKLMRASAAGLMDAAPDKEIMAKIRKTIENAATGALEFHDLKARAVGPMVFIDFHLVVPSAMSVFDAHAICDRIEAALREAIGQVSVSIHVEPEGEVEGGRHGAVLMHRCAPVPPARAMEQKPPSPHP